MQALRDIPAGAHARLARVGAQPRREEQVALVVQRRAALGESGLGTVQDGGLDAAVRQRARQGFGIEQVGPGRSHPQLPGLQWASTLSLTKPW